MGRISGVTITDDMASRLGLPFPCEAVKGRIYTCDVQKRLLELMEEAQLELVKDYAHLQETLKTGDYKVREKNALEQRMQDMTLLGHALARLRADLLSDAWWADREGEAGIA